MCFVLLRGTASNPVRARAAARRSEARGAWEASGDVRLEPFLSARVDSGGSGITRLFREFVNLLLPRNSRRTITLPVR